MHTYNRVPTYGRLEQNMVRDKGAPGSGREGVLKIRRDGLVN